MVFIGTFIFPIALLLLWAILEIIDKVVTIKPPHKLVIIFRVALILGTVLSGYIAIKENYLKRFDDKVEFQTSGVLLPTEHNMHSKRESRILAIGHAWYIFTADHDTLFTDKDELLLGLSIKDGKLTISATIRNPDGSLAAKIRDNKWMPAPDCPDWNYTDNLIEVYDKFNNIVLQVVHLGEVISLQAILRTKSGWTYGLGIKTLDATAVPPSGFLKWPTNYEPMLKIQPICEEIGAIEIGNCPGYDRLVNIVETGRDAPIWLEISDAIDLSGPDTTGISMSNSKAVSFQATTIEIDQRHPCILPVFLSPRPVDTKIIENGKVTKKKYANNELKYIVRLECITQLFAKSVMGLIFDATSGDLYQSVGLAQTVTLTKSELMIFEKSPKPLALLTKTMNAHSPNFPEYLFDIGKNDMSYIALFYYSPTGDPICMKYFINISDDDITVRPGSVIFAGETQ